MNLSYFLNKKINLAILTLLLLSINSISAWTGPPGAPPACPAGSVGCAELLDVNRDQSIGGIKTFTGTAIFDNPITIGAPTSSSHAATRGYVDSVSGAIPLGRTSGDTGTGYLLYAGTTRTPGRLYGGTTAPSGTTRLNYDGYLYATQLYDGGTRVAISTRNIGTGDGLLGGGDLTANRTLTVDSTVVRTSGDQTIGGTKTFSSPVVVAAPTGPTHATTKEYVDSAIITGITGSPTNLGYIAAATTGTITSSTGTSATIPAATTTLAGLMTNTDKTKLDGIAAGAQVNVPTNLGIIAGTTAGPIITSSTGTNVTLPTASETASGVVTTGNQTWAGTKTFSSPVVVATPTGPTHATTKEYVDSVSGAIPLGRTSGDTGTGYLLYAGTTRTAGRLYGGTTAPSGTTRLNYDGYLYATRLYDGGTRVAISTRNIGTGDGLSGGGDLTANRTLTVDSTVVRTSGDQTIGGTKTFSSPVVVATPTGPTHAATKGYVDSTIGEAIAGTTQGTVTSVGTGDGLTGGPITSSGTISVDSTVVRTTGNQTIGGTKTFSSAVVLSTAGTATNHAVRADRTISTTNGITGGGNLTANRTLSLDSTVVRTSGDQTIAGTKTFTGSIVATANPVAVGAPIADNHAATRGYVNSMFSGSGPWTLSGSNVYVTNTSHNVGIGTTSPLTSFHVAGISTFNSIGRFASNGNGFYFGEQSSAYRNPATNIPAMVIRMDESNTGLDETKASLVLYNANGGQYTGAGLTFASREAVGAGNDVALSGIFGIKESTGTAGAWSQGGLRFWTKNFGNIIEAMSVRYDGNVGIGTTSPSYKLDVSGTGRFTSTVEVGAPTGPNHAATKQYVDSAITDIGIGGYVPTSRTISTTNGITGGGDLTANRTLSLDSTVVRTTGNQTIAGVKNFSGNVGIGTATPGAKLTIADNGSPAGARLLDIGDDTYLTDIDSANTLGIYGIQDITRSRLKLGSTGGIISGYNNNIGINQALPAYRLDVNGTGRFTSTVEVGAPTGPNHAATKQYVDSAITDIGIGGYVPTSRTISTTNGITGGGDLSANRTLSLDSTVVRTTGNQTIGGTKTFSSAVVLSTAGTATNHAVRADRTISTTNGITGGGNLTANRTLSLDSTVVRTTGDQTIAGTKTFTGSIVATANPVAVGAPIADNHAATRGYVDSAIVDIGIGGYVPTSRTISTTNGITGGGDLTANRTLSLDSTVVRTTGNQTLGGIKTFSGGISVTGGVLNLNNNNITGVNNLVITDPGVNEGIEWAGGSLWKIYESPDDLTNASGNLQFVTNATRRATLYTNGDLWLGGTATVATPTGPTHATTKAYVDSAIAGIGIGGYVPTSRTISTTNGITGGGDLTANRTLSLDSTVIRTTGNQTIGGTKTFSSPVVASYYNVNSGVGNGIRFWASDSYKISMGNTAEYKYGSVTDYSIKMNMSSEATRGWTWGVVGVAPIAAINTQGNMSLAGSLVIGGTATVGAPTSGSHAATKAYVDTAIAGTTQGTVTSVGTGSGLTGGPITSSGTISVDSTVLRTTANQGITGKLYPASTNNRRAGMYGVYDSYKIGHIWSMGTGYQIPEDGSNFGNLYGLAYKHTNNTTGGTMAGGHQMVWVVNGTGKAALGESGIWTSGTGVFGGTVTVGTPTGSTHAATKGYVDSAIANIGIGGYVPTSRTISTTNGITGGGDLTANRTLSLDSTVIRTTGNQTIGGTKTFSSPVVASYYNVNSGVGNGIRFWASDSYKISMGNTAEYKYGSVTDYSIKMNMSNTTTRGWTWGVVGVAPIAAINTQGNMNLAGSLVVGGTATVGTPTSGSHAATKAYVDTAIAGTTQGTVTSVGTGSGLTGGPITSSGTISVDSTVLRTTANQGITGKLYPASTSNRRAGLYGVYDSYKIGHIWSMGTGYQIPEDGSNFGNLYGLAYKHTNNTTGGTMAGGHQMVWVVNGTGKAALGESGIWTSGTGVFGSTVTVGTPTSGSHAATKAYVDSAIVNLGIGGYVPTSRTISTTNGITGGGDLTANRTLSLDSTVVRTTGNQTIGGTKTFSSTISGSITGNAGTVGGLSVHTGRNNEANKVVRTDGSGYIQAGWINTTSGDRGTTAPTRIYASNDAYIRYYTPANFAAVMNTWLVRTSGNQTIAGVKNFSGNVGVGVASPAEKLEVGGNVVANAYYYSSDIRKKENVTNIENSLSKILQLQGISYNLKDEEDKRMGFSAQELQKVYPELVKEGSDGYLSIDGTGLIAPLVESIKEQQKKIEELEEKINILMQKQ